MSPHLPQLSDAAAQPAQAAAVGVIHRLGVNAGLIEDEASGR
jgi:hypothetical protein